MVKQVPVHLQLHQQQQQQVAALHPQYQQRGGAEQAQASISAPHAGVSP
jgi:hypothetical protein